jgi:hypothetical protein
VISIVIASISAMASLGTGCQAAAFMQMRRVSSSMASTTATVATPPPPPAVAAPTTGGTDADAQIAQGQNGLNAADRATAIEALNSLAPLSDEQKHQLQIFLAEHGENIFPTAGATLSAAQVKAIVTSSSSNSPTNGSDASNTSFVTARGTFAVYSDKVEFRRRGGDDTITTGDAASAANSSNSTPSPWGYSFVPLKPRDVQQILTSIGQQPGVKLTSGQSATLTQQLQNPQQKLVQSSSGGAPPVLSAQMTPDGSVWVQFNTSSALTVNPSGQITASYNPMTSMPGSNISAWVCLGLAGASLLSIGLAIVLLIGAIQVMRQAPSGKRLHLLWAWLQIPVAAAGWSLVVLLYYQLTQVSIAGMMPPGTASTVYWSYFGFAAGAVVVAWIYPVSLLIVFRTRSMRAYYNVVQMQ